MGSRYSSRSSRSVGWPAWHAGPGGSRDHARAPGPAQLQLRAGSYTQSNTPPFLGCSESWRANSWRPSAACAAQQPQRADERPPGPAARGAPTGRALPVGAEGAKGEETPKLGRQQPADLAALAHGQRNRWPAGGAAGSAKGGGRGGLDAAARRAGFTASSATYSWPRRDAGSEYAPPAGSRGGPWPAASQPGSGSMRVFVCMRACKPTCAAACPACGGHPRCLWPWRLPLLCQRPKQRTCGRSGARQHGGGRRLGRPVQRWPKRSAMPPGWPQPSSLGCVALRLLWARAVPQLLGSSRVVPSLQPSAHVGRPAAHSAPRPSPCGGISNSGPSSRPGPSTTALAPTCKTHSRSHTHALRPHLETARASFICQ